MAPHSPSQYQGGWCEGADTCNLIPAAFLPRLSHLLLPLLSFFPLRLIALKGALSLVFVTTLTLFFFPSHMVYLFFSSRIAQDILFCQKFKHWEFYFLKLSVLHFLSTLIAWFLSWRLSVLVPNSCLEFWSPPRSVLCMHILLNYLFYDPVWACHPLFQLLLKNVSCLEGISRNLGERTLPGSRRGQDTCSFMICVSGFTLRPYLGRGFLCS